MVWCALLVLCWPLAILTVIVVPLLWLIALPFRIVFIVLEAGISLFRELLLLPARWLHHRSS